MQNEFCLKDIAQTLSIRYHCTESNEHLPSAVALNGTVSIDRLRNNLGLLFHPKEISLFNKIGNSDRANEFLMGRFIAKYALNLLSGTESYNNICIDRGTFMQPILLANNSPSLDISITHKQSKVAAIVFPKSHPMGIDLEKIDKFSRHTLESQMTKPEILTLASSSQNYINSLWQLWVVKEAISKVLKTGLTTSFLLFETRQHTFDKDGKLSCYFTHFYQYFAQSWVLNDYVLAIVHPRTTQFDMDIPSNYTSDLLLSENLQ